MKVKVRMNIHGIFKIKSATMVEKKMQAEAMETEPSQTDADTKKEEGDNGVKKEGDNGAEQQPEQQPDQQQPDTTPQQEGEKDSGEKQEQQEPENMDVCSSSCNFLHATTFVFLSEPAFYK